MDESVCAWCGKEYEPWLDKQVFCSVECGNAWIKNGRKWPRKCNVCGNAYYGNGNSKYCSRKCSSKAAAEKPRKRSGLIKVCLVCEKEFIATSAGKRYCSVECRTEADKRWADKRKKYYCLYCGNECKPNSSGHIPKQYCSIECSGKGRNKGMTKQPRPILQKECAECGQAFETREESKATCCAACHARQKGKSRFVPKVCVCQECGGTFLTEYARKNRIYCSVNCQDRAVTRNGHLARKIYISRAFVEKVRYREIYERDNGVCGICGKPVADERNCLSVWGATIDHIIPLSYGGEHSKDNCQLAHRGCNSLKSRGGAEFKIADIDAVAESFGWLKREPTL